MKKIQTFVKGTKKEVNEIVNELNELLKSKKFTYSKSKEKNTYLILGEVSLKDIKKYNFQNDFLIY